MSDPNCGSTAGTVVVTITVDQRAVDWKVSNRNNSSQGLT